MKRERDSNREVARNVPANKAKNDALVEILRRLSPDELQRYMARIWRRWIGDA